MYDMKIQFLAPRGEGNQWKPHFMEVHMDEFWWIFNASLKSLTTNNVSKINLAMFFSASNSIFPRLISKNLKSQFFLKFHDLNSSVLILGSNHWYTSKIIPFFSNSYIPIQNFTKPEVIGESCNRGWGAEAPSMCVGGGAPLQFGGFSSVPVED